jgi:hypothetical protein
VADGPNAARSRLVQAGHDSLARPPLWRAPARTGARVHRVGRPRPRSGDRRNEHCLQPHRRDAAATAPLSRATRARHVVGSAARLRAQSGGTAELRRLERAESHVHVDDSRGWRRAHADAARRHARTPRRPGGYRVVLRRARHCPSRGAHVRRVRRHARYARGHHQRASVAQPLRRRRHLDWSSRSNGRRTGHHCGRDAGELPDSVPRRSLDGLRARPRP